MIVYFVLAILPGLVAVVLYEYKRATKLRYMARAERACAEFGAIRHELTLAMAKGEIGDADAPAADFLVRASGDVLHASEFFREFTTVICVAYATDTLPKNARYLDKSQTTDFTRPYIQRFVTGLDSLIEEFAHPFLAILATLNGDTVISSMHQLGEHTRELRRRREELERLRDAGTAALAAA